MSKDKQPNENTAKVLKTCAICGKQVEKTVTNPAYPEKGVCLSCLNGYVVNLNTVEEELHPFIDSMDKAVSDLKARLDKQ